MLDLSLRVQARGIEELQFAVDLAAKGIEQGVMWNGIATDSTHVEWTIDERPDDAPAPAITASRHSAP